MGKLLCGAPPSLPPPHSILPKPAHPSPTPLTALPRRRKVTSLEAKLPSSYIKSVLQLVMANENEAFMLSDIPAQRDPNRQFFAILSLLCFLLTVPVVGLTALGFKK